MINYICDHCGKRCGQGAFYGRNKWLTIDLSDEDHSSHHFCPMCAVPIEAYVKRYLKNLPAKKKL